MVMMMIVTKSTKKQICETGVQDLLWKMPTKWSLDFFDVLLPLIVVDIRFCLYLVICCVLCYNFADFVQKSIPRALKPIPCISVIFPWSAIFMTEPGNSSTFLNCFETIWWRVLVDHDVWPPIIEIISRHVLVDYVRQAMIIGIISRALAAFPATLATIIEPLGLPEN